MTKELIALTLLALVLYGAVEAWPLVAGPALTIVSPIENASIQGGVVAIEGRALRAAQLTLNGTPLLHEEDGSFATTLTLPRGGSILTVEARDRFGRTVEQTRAVYIP